MNRLVCYPLIIPVHERVKFYPNYCIVPITQGTFCFFGIILYHFHIKATYNSRAYHILKIRGVLVTSSVWFCQVNKGNHVLCCDLTNYNEIINVILSNPSQLEFLSCFLYPSVKSGKPIKTCNILPVPV